MNLHSWLLRLFQNKKGQKNLRYPTTKAVFFLRKGLLFFGYLKFFDPSYFEPALVDLNETIIFSLLCRELFIVQGWFICKNQSKPLHDQAQITTNVCPIVLFFCHFVLVWELIQSMHGTEPTTDYGHTMAKSLILCCPH